MSARVMNALGATRRSSARSARAPASRASMATTRRLARGRPGGVAARALRSSSGAGTRSRPRRTSGASSSRPAGAARGSSSSTPTAAAPPASPTSTCSRCPGTDGALALGHDARDRRRRPRRRGVVPRARASATTSCSSGSASTRSSACAAICGVPAERSARLARELATTQPSLIRLGVGAQRHAGAPIAYRTIACLPGARRLLAAPRRRLLLHPDGHVRRARLDAPRAARAPPGPVRAAQHVRSSARR